MREDDVRIFLGLLIHSVEITKADTEDNVASVAGELVNSLLNFLVILRYIVNNVEILGRIESNLLHRLGNTVVMRISVTCCVVLAVDVDSTNLEV